MFQSVIRPLYHLLGSRCCERARNAARFLMSVSTGSVEKNSRTHVPVVAESHGESIFAQPAEADRDSARSSPLGASGWMVVSSGNSASTGVDRRLPAEGDVAIEVAGHGHAGHHVHVDESFVDERLAAPRRSRRPIASGSRSCASRLIARREPA